MSLPDPHPSNPTSIEIRSDIPIGRDPANRPAWMEGDRRLSLALEHSPASIVVTDPEGTIEYVNPRFTEVSGYTAQEAIGRNPRILASGNTPREVYDELWTTLRRGEVWHGQFQNRRKDRIEYWEKASIAPIVESDGRISGYVAIKEDITEQKRTDLRLLASNADLERATEIARAMAKAASEANAAKGEFLANMSHEIRTPMNGVIGMACLLLDTELDPEQRRYAEVLRTSAESLLALLNDILDFSKAEAGRMELECIRFDPRRLLDEVEQASSYRLHAQGLGFEVEVEGLDGAPLLGDPNRLRQILNNLVGNAAKFTRSGNVRLGLGVESETDSVTTLRFSVADTGIGIPPEAQQRLFRKFSQVDASTTREYGGTGLGLAISRQLVELMGGEIGVTSPAPRSGRREPGPSEGPGSEFWFVVPFAKSPSGTVLDSNDSGSSDSRPGDSRTSPPSSLADLFRDSSLRILVVEDNLTNQEVAMGMLRKLGIGSRLASSGSQAIAMLEIEDFDLVLMDVHMPEMDGLTATRVIRDPGSRVLDHRIPVVGLSASTLKGDLEKGMAAGMDDYLTKPVDPRSLARVLDRWVRGLHPPAVEPIADPPSSTPDPESTVLDPRAFLDRILGDVELARTLATLFAEDAREQCAQLKELLDQGDAQGASRVAHKLKGAAGSVCAYSLQSLSKRLEGSLAAGDLGTARALFPVLEETIPRVCAELAAI
jgi:PAS domain S-box-containing protein